MRGTNQVSGTDRVATVTTRSVLETRSASTSAEAFYSTDRVVTATMCSTVFG